MQSTPTVTAAGGARCTPSAASRAFPRDSALSSLMSAVDIVASSLFLRRGSFSVLGSFSLVTGRQQNDPQKKCGSKRPRPVTNTFPCVTIEDTIPGPTERRASQGPALFSLSLGEQGALSPSQRITTPVVVFETTPAWSTLGFLSLVVAFLKVVRSETQLWIEAAGQRASHRWPDRAACQRGQGDIELGQDACERCLRKRRHARLTIRTCAPSRASVGARFEEGFLLATHTSVGSQRRCSRVAPKNRRTTRRAFCVGLGPTRDRDHSRESAWLRPRLARVPHFSRRALPRNPPAAHDSRRMPPCNPRQRGARDHSRTREPAWQADLAAALFKKVTPAWAIREGQRGLFAVERIYMAHAPSWQRHRSTPSGLRPD